MRIRKMKKTLNRWLLENDLEIVILENNHLCVHKEGVGSHTIGRLEDFIRYTEDGYIKFEFYNYVPEERDVCRPFNRTGKYFTLNDVNVTDDERKEIRSCLN